MNIRSTSVSLLVFAGAALTTLQANGFAADQSRSITLTEKLQIPEAVLKPGTYTFAVEDRLTDRAIVRITSAEGNKHYLLLSVPNQKLSGYGNNGLILFQSTEGKRPALRGWMCTGCTTGLEFVYPKAEAVKITDESTESVLAFDHEYNKLPSNLSADDMKVVTLWVLSPERITAENKGVGVKAAKYSSVSRVSVPVETAQVSPRPEPAAPPLSNEMASAAVPQAGAQELPRRHLPKTASNTFSLALWGVLSLIAWAGLYLSRRRSA